MPEGKRAGGRTPHLRSAKRIIKAGKGARSNNDNQELPGVNIDARRIVEIEEAQELVETVSKRASVAIEKAHKTLDDAKKALVAQMKAHGFDAEKKPVYTRMPWGSVVLQKKGEVKEEAKYTPGTAKAKKKKSEDGDSEEDE